MAPSRKKSLRSASVEAAEKAGVATSDHKIASVPPMSFSDDYVSRKISGIDDHRIFEYAHKHKINVLIEGPTGPGKTTAVLAYAARSKNAFYAIPSNVGVEPSQLFGKYIPDGQGSFIWQDGPVTDIVRNGGVLLINEVNFMPARVATVLFGLLDKRREVALLDHRAEVIKAHPNLLVVADMNPDYTGTNTLNQAFRNRFAIQLHWDYDDDVEAKLVKSQSLRTFASQIRKDYERGQIVTPMSTNMLMEFESLAKFDFDFACANLLNHFAADERSAVDVLINTHSENISNDLFPKKVEPVIVTDNQGNDWTQRALDELRAENYNNPTYVDPELGRYGIDFEWGDEEDEEDMDDASYLKSISA